MKRDLYLTALLPFAVLGDLARSAAEALDTYLADAVNGADDE